MKLQAKTMDELAVAIIAEISKTTKVVGLAWDLTWGEKISNSHNAPYGYLTNWGGKDKDKYGDPVPNGYPGLTGRIWIRYDTTPESFNSGRLLERVRIYTGTGGAGSYDGIWADIAGAVYRHNSVARSNKKKMVKEVHCYGWDCRVFDFDFPDIRAALALKYEQELAWTTLNNSAPPKIPSHTFTWTDPATMYPDEAFIADSNGDYNWSNA